MTQRLTKLARSRVDEFAIICYDCWSRTKYFNFWPINVFKPMLDFNTLIENIAIKWVSPSEAIHRGELCPFKLKCEFDDDRASIEEISKLNFIVPTDLSCFWTMHRAARLFVDVAYGQWGLKIHTPTESAEATSEFASARGNDAQIGDLIIGSFLGDSDLLLVRCDVASDDFGSLIVVLPIDHRNKWPVVSTDFSSFLEIYGKSDGDKYWETAGFTLKR